MVLGRRLGAVPFGRDNTTATEFRSNLKSVALAAVFGNTKVRG